MRWLVSILFSEENNAMDPTEPQDSTPDDVAVPVPDTLQGQESTQPLSALPPYRYGGWGLAAFVAIYAVSWWFAIIGFLRNSETTNIAFDLVVLESWGMLLLDWRGFTSLRGRAVWVRLSRGKKFWLVCGLLFIPEVIVGVYFWLAITDYYRATQQKPEMQVRTLYQRYKVSPSSKRAITASTSSLVLSYSWY